MRPNIIKNIIKAKQSFFPKELTIKSDVFPKKYIQFSVPEMINEDPDNVCLLVKQIDESKEFIEFFKNVLS
ncbi:hypothetical protein [Anaerosphaera multitolerans]|uniref:Uncharacterized protein n=1 Tax=Anaerosphaera multitolerans TaxID=2487351 RepID=A0A437S5W1_9FIRM|nr:hypothetical protein [Anaerosphaera multitolerans]RVU54415.1 hypothetical protein EF514_07420 [Anaerosphaera multitolerans]